MSTDDLQSFLDTLARAFLDKARDHLTTLGGVMNMVMCTGRDGGLVVCSLDGAEREAWPLLVHALQVAHRPPWLVHVSEAWQSHNTAFKLCQDDPQRSEVIVVEATAGGLLSILTQRFTRPPTGGVAFDPPDTWETDNERRYSYVFGIGSARRPVAQEQAP